MTHFAYVGPLPDLQCATEHGPAQIVRCVSLVRRPNGIQIGVSVANWRHAYAGPFRIKLLGRFGRRSELVFDFNGLRADDRSMRSEYRTRNETLLNVRDVSVQTVLIDFEEEVCESDEANKAVRNPLDR